MLVLLLGPCFQVEYSVLLKFLRIQFVDFTLTIAIFYIDDLLSVIDDYIQRLA